MFEGTVGGSYTGDIAIDDLKVVSGVCPNPGELTLLIAHLCVDPTLF